MVAAEDFTVKAGTISQAANSKRYRAAELAVADRVPLVMLLEGAGFHVIDLGVQVPPVEPHRPVEPQ